MGFKKEELKVRTKLVLTIGIFGLFIMAGVLAIPASADEEGPYEGMITINADGSVSPSDAPVKVHKDMYKLKCDVLGSVLILKDGITFNGADHTIVNSNYNFGIWLNGVDGVTLKNCHVTGFIGGVRLDYASNNVIKANSIYGNINAGIAVFYWCNENVFKDNEIYMNTYGMAIQVYSSYNEVKDNYIHDNADYGVRCYFGSNYNLIKDNMFLRNGDYGIWFYYCGYNTAQDNVVDGVAPYFMTNAYGIRMEYGIGNHVVKNNDVSNVHYTGIVVESCPSNVIKENEVYDSFIGISVWRSSNIDVLKNYVHDNERPGIDVEESYYVNVMKNTVVDCKHGLFVEDTSDDDSYNVYCKNTLMDNMYGIYINTEDATGNTFHHNNIVNNDDQVHTEADASDNAWDDGGGEGNYWSDYTGMDHDHDGVGDTDLPHNGVDNYPLMNKV